MEIGFLPKKAIICVAAVPEVDIILKVNVACCPALVGGCEVLYNNRGVILVDKEWPWKLSTC